MTTDPITTDDLLDIRDIIARFEDLQQSADAIADGSTSSPLDDEETEELRKLGNLLDELRGQGGDEQWQGAWFPVTLIRDSYFEDYARQLAEDIGAITGDEQWPANCIDWERAADMLKGDYFTVDFDGETYWTR